MRWSLCWGHVRSAVGQGAWLCRRLCPARDPCGSTSLPTGGRWLSGWGWRPSSPRGGQVGAAGDFCLGGHGITAQQDRLLAKQREGWRGGVNA